MKEAYVKIETAQLLKEKGFAWRVFNFYDEHGGFSEHIGSVYSLYNWNYPTKDEYGSQYCSAPTQQMACSWLREEKGIHIYPIPVTGFNYVVSIYTEQGNKTYDRILSRSGRNAYEDAVEAALQYCLTKLIEQ